MSESGLKRVKIDGSGLQVSRNGWEKVRVNGSRQEWVQWVEVYESRGKWKGVGESGWEQVGVGGTAVQYNTLVFSHDEEL